MSRRGARSGRAHRRPRPARGSLATPSRRALERGAGRVRVERLPYFARADRRNSSPGTEQLILVGDQAAGFVLRLSRQAELLRARDLRDRPSRPGATRTARRARCALADALGAPRQTARPRAAASCRICRPARSTPTGVGRSIAHLTCPKTPSSPRRRSPRAGRCSWPLARARPHDYLPTDRRLDRPADCRSPSAPPSPAPDRKVVCLARRRRRHVHAAGAVDPWRAKIST